MEIIVLSVVIVIVVCALSFGLMRALQLINTMNKRQIYILERTFDIFGVYISGSAHEMEKNTLDLEKVIEEKIGNPDEPYDAFKDEDVT